MDGKKDYLINKVGTCRKCVTTNGWGFCGVCGVLVCDKHDSDGYGPPVCDLCKYVPDGHTVCIICDCPAICAEEYDEGFSTNMAFSQSRVSSITEVATCDNCRTCFIDPHVYPKTDLFYQSFACVINEHGGVYIGGPRYDLFRAGNEINYKLIQDGRKQITEYYKKTIPGFILPGIAMIIMEYCGFARDIVFEEVIDETA